MTEIRSDSDNIDNQLTDETILEDSDNTLFNAEADEYFMNIRDELGQVDRLISDAVNNLVINFRYISELAKTHHEMVLAIERMTYSGAGESISELLDKQMNIADKIQQELEITIISLQFGDLVTQLLTHTTHQVEMLNMGLQRVDREDNWRNDKMALHAIHEGITKAVNIAKTRNNRKPVVQQGMQMGDIELF